MGVDDAAVTIGEGLMTDAKIAIVGSGANGTSVGVDLTRAGLDVVLVEQWPEHVAAMRAAGARIEMPDQTVQVPVRAYNLCDVATFTERFDIVLVLMKAYDTSWACQLIEPYLQPDSIVVGLQNGMTTDVVASVVGAERTVGAVIEISSMMTEPGIVQRHSGIDRSYFAVGGIEGTPVGREREIADLLRLSGAVEIVDDIRAAKRMKLVSNCTTLAATAAVGLPIVEAAKLPGMRALMVRAGQEALDAAASAGVGPVPIFGLTAAALDASDALVEMLLDTLLAGFVLPHTTTTILHDWLKGRHSEVDDINGLVVAEQAGRDGGAPANAAIVEVAHRIERGELAPDPANLELLLELASGTVARERTA
jgi:2-dehydropantoate 2-reductase